ncbi:MAG: sugar transferase [Actinomyces sp.]|uniref:sugar transferase n=1 Tax=Actinomyces sp. TaxID=29317 RepID=UPI0026DCB3AE|nr:sugar transferase [Actinomyces sp.]MDO4243407.1 sugar transferase [Actinomyces sp.]
MSQACLVPYGASNTTGPHSMARFQRLLHAGDLLIITLVMLTCNVLNVQAAEMPMSGSVLGLPTGSIVLCAFIVLSWWLFLIAMKSHVERILGYGPDEFLRATQATVTVFGALALLSYLSGIQLPRAYFLTTLPLGFLALLAWRWAARRYFVRARRRGTFTHPTFVVGSPESVASVVTTIEQRPELGLAPRGAFLAGSPAERDEAPDLSVPVVGAVEDLEESLEGVEGVTVLITQTPRLTPPDIRRISWALGPTSQLIMVPSVLDVSGQRLHLRPIGGISLLEIQIGSFGLLRARAKRVCDILIAALLIVVLLPVWLIIPLLIWREDRGPAFFRQTRIGLSGREFRIWKFRTMRVNADGELAALLASQGTADTPLFKVDRDPRITGIGNMLRRTSLDELPQLFNVLEGSMSLVGPRPQVPQEVELYDETAARRLLVKPGMTGMWQVNGRSRLSWEEALRFDLFYVENWTFSLDLQILLKTVKVVLAREGSA